MIKKHSLTILGHRTSVTLEDAFYDALKLAAQEENLSLSHLIGQIEQEKKVTYNLSSAIRVFLFKRAQSKQKASNPGWAQRQTLDIVAIFRYIFL